MSTSLERFGAHLRAAEAELARDVAAQQQRWRYRVHAGRVWFDDEVRRAHASLRQSIPAYIQRGNVLSLITAPVIYSLIVPLVMLDLWVITYQWICFPIYGVARVRRRAYFVFDRRKLGYLNGIEKVGCTYCSYATGLLAYVREVAARTEAYWCPIRHAHAILTPHGRYHTFVEYGDAERYHADLVALRRTLRPHVPCAETDGTATAVMPASLSAAIPRSSAGPAPRDKNRSV